MIRLKTGASRHCPVTQIFNLLYRRVALGWAMGDPHATETIQSFADYKSAIQQSATLRYGGSA